MGYWLIEEQRSGAVLGWGGIRFVAVDGQRVLNLAYRVSLHQWGRGIGSWVARHGLATARSRFPEVPVVARVAPDNATSTHIAEKVGLRLAGPDHQGWPVYADRSLCAGLLLALPPA